MTAALALNPCLFVEAANEAAEKAADLRWLSERVGLDTHLDAVAQNYKLANMYFNMLVRDGLVCC